MRSNPFFSILAMWEAHRMYATNDTPAINEETYFYFASTLFYLHRRSHDVFVVTAFIDICSADAFAQIFEPTGHATQPLCHECHCVTNHVGH